MSEHEEVKCEKNRKRNNMKKSGDHRWNKSK